MTCISGDENGVAGLRTGIDGWTIADGAGCRAEGAGCVEVFQEKISGAKADRKQLARLIARLDKGDVLVVTRLDRLARSTRDLLKSSTRSPKKGAGFQAR